MIKENGSPFAGASAIEWNVQENPAPQYRDGGSLRSADKNTRDKTHLSYSTKMSKVRSEIERLKGLAKDHTNGEAMLVIAQAAEHQYPLEKIAT